VIGLGLPNRRKKERNRVNKTKQHTGPEGKGSAFVIPRGFGLDVYFLRTRVFLKTKPFRRRASPTPWNIV